MITVYATNASFLDLLRFAVLLLVVVTTLPENEG